MIIDELHPDILGYYKEMEQILEKDRSAILFEFRKRIIDEEPIGIFLWLNKLFDQNLLPKEIDKPLTNLYWAIR